MKKILIFAALALMAAACRKTEAPELNVSTNTLTFGPEGGSFPVSITSNQEWTVIPGEEWMALSTLQGSGSATLTVEVAPFTEASARSGQLTLKAGELQQTIAVVQSSPVAPDHAQENHFQVLALGGNFQVEVPRGYTFTIESDADWIQTQAGDGSMTLTVAPNAQSTERRSAVVKALFGQDALVEVTVDQNYRNVEPGELVIEEVYFTGSPIEGSNRPSSDQYIKITNRADHTVYADRVMFVTSFITGTITSVGAYYEYPALEDGLAVENMYVIPGDGDDYPLQSGESMVLALAAIDYTASYGSGDDKVDGNPNAIDLSHADFEFYDENDIYPDTDNPDVPNLEIWFKASATVTTLHQRGFESYALCIPPYNETAQSILDQRHWTGQFTFYFNEYVIPRKLDSQDVWVLPGEWVLDAVNCSLADVWYQNPWPAAFDAGWTYCGAYDGDPARFGKSVRRKVEDGVLADTNNSTNDFMPNATPSLKK